MTQELDLKAGDDLSGWALVQARLSSRGRHFSSTLRVHRRSSPGEAEEILLPIFPDGGINELVRFPDDVARLSWRLPASAQLQQPQLTIRPVGWLGRTVRMVNRVARTYLRLSKDQRLEEGLTLWRALHDLPGAYRIATGFRVRYPMFDYPEWIERFDTLHERDRLEISDQIARWTARPHFHLLVAAGGAGHEAIQATLASLQTQLYRDFTYVVLDQSDAAGVALDSQARIAGAEARFVPQGAIADWLAGFNAALAQATADGWVMLLRAGDALPAHALYWFACEARSRPEAAILYADDDSLDTQGRRGHPRFKPDWSPAHFRSTHYVGAAAVLRGAAVTAAGGVTLDCCRHGNYDLMLRVIDSSGEKIAHVPAVLLHRGNEASAASAWEDPRWCAGALRAHLARNGVAADIAQTFPGCRRVRYRLPDTPPLVSIIVPTRDQGALLRQCVESVLEKSTYPRFEVLVVDNQSADSQTLAYLDALAGRRSVRVLRYDRRFNFSAINNFAARTAAGEMLCLLNNDTEVIAPDWLEEMVGHLTQAGVGAVGAKLYYPDGRVQHAGVAVGPGGCADHLHLNLMREEPGYCNRAVVAHELSAVTGACLLTWKHVYQRLAGLNEKDLTVAFNDVDYCLRLQEAGLRVIFASNAELYHHESASRGNDNPLPRRLRARREVKYMRRRWSKRMRHDPYYNPNLSYRRPDFSLGETARVKKPWRDGE
jgi:GT2 family glycosyltransferase